MIWNTVVEECESTNDLCKQMGEQGAPHGSWISAHIQTGGRGRQGRQWSSVPGNLLLSVLLRPFAIGISKTDLVWIPLMVGVRAFQAISAQIEDPSTLRLKWPNDLVILTSGRFLKIGGILCEAYVDSKVGFVVCGLGINCQASPLHEAKSGNIQVNADQLRVELAREIANPWSTEEIRTFFESKMTHVPGDFIQYTSNTSSELFAGHVVKLGPSGQLVVRNDQGEEKSLYSEEIHLK